MTGPYRLESIDGRLVLYPKDLPYDPGLRLLLGFAGNRYRFANDGEFPGQPETVYLSTLQSRLTAELEWKAGSAVRSMPRAGRRRPSSSSSRTTRTSPTGYLKVGARFTFGKSILDEWKK